MRNQLLFIFLAFFIQFASAQNRPYDLMLNTLYAHSVPTISVGELQKGLSKEAPILLDAREAKEFNISHIKGAKYVGYDYFKIERLKDIPKNKAIVVYCSVGYRSEKIAEKLKKAGYTDVKNLYGGIFEWVNSGYEVVDNQQKTTSKVHGFSKEWGIWLTKGTTVY